MVRGVGGYSSMSAELGDSEQVGFGQSEKAKKELGKRVASLLVGVDSTVALCYCRCSW